MQIIPSLKVVGCSGWLPVPVCAHAGEAVQELHPGGPVAGTAQPPEGSHCHAAQYAGR